MKRLDDKARKLAEDNINLCYTYAREYAKGHQRAMRYFRWSMDDLKSIIFVGLCKAARDFDPEKGFKFSTIAYYYFRNEIWKVMRHDCSQRARVAFDAVSLDTPLPRYEDLSLADIILQNGCRADDDNDKDLLAEVRESMIYALTEKEQAVMRLYLDGFTQKEIAAAHNCYQVQISRVIIRSREKLAKFIQENR